MLLTSVCLAQIQIQARDTRFAVCLRFSLAVAYKLGDILFVVIHFIRIRNDQRFAMQSTGLEQWVSLWLLRNSHCITSLTLTHRHISLLSTPLCTIVQAQRHSLLLRRSFSCKQPRLALFRRRPFHSPFTLLEIWVSQCRCVYRFVLISVYIYRLQLAYHQLMFAAFKNSIHF